MKVPVKINETDAYKKRVEEYENKKRLIISDDELKEELTQLFEGKKITFIAEIVVAIILAIMGLLMINSLIHMSVTDYIDSRVESEVSSWLS